MVLHKVHKNYRTFLHEGDTSTGRSMMRNKTQYTIDVFEIKCRKFTSMAEEPLPNEGTKQILDAESNRKFKMNSEYYDTSPE